MQLTYYTGKYPMFCFLLGTGTTTFYVNGYDYERKLSSHIKNVEMTYKGIRIQYGHETSASLFLAGAFNVLSSCDFCLGASTFDFNLE